MSEALWQVLALVGTGVAWVAFVFVCASLADHVREALRREETQPMRQIMEGALRPTNDPPPNPPRAKAVSINSPVPTTEHIEGPAFGIVNWGSTFEMRPDGWYVNGEPYNPDEDGVHQPSGSSTSPRWEGTD